MKFPTIDFVGKRKIYFTISTVLILAAILSSFFFGVKLDIQFSGGTILTYSYGGEVTEDDVRSAVGDLLDGYTFNVAMQEDNNIHKTTFVISLATSESIKVELQSAITSKLTEQFAENSITLEQSNIVNPTIGANFFRKCLVAMLLVFVCILFYIWVRFRKIGGWVTGFSALIALLHDVAIVYAAFVFFRIPIDTNFMAVVLTILGYSVNDTIVIFDRLRENQRLLPREISQTELANVSTNQSLTRCIYTALATAISMLVVSIFAVISGISSIISFSVPLLFGIISGAYSTLFLSVPIYVMLHRHTKTDSEKRLKRKNKKRNKKAKA